MVVGAEGATLPAVAAVRDNIVVGHTGDTSRPQQPATSRAAPARSGIVIGTWRGNREYFKPFYVNIFYGCDGLVLAGLSNHGGAPVVQRIPAPAPTARAAPARATARSSIVIGSTRRRRNLVL